MVFYCRLCYNEKNVASKENSNMLFLILLYLALIALLIWVYVFVTRQFADIAESKGYDRLRYWRISFWLGAVGD